MASRIKNVFVTGGTGSIGQAILEIFSKSNYHVFFQYMSNNELAKEVSDKTGATAWKSNFLSHLDLPDESFDIVINSAGFNITKSLTHEVSLEEWRSTIEMNLTAPFLIIKKYIPFMVSQKWGRIINIGSIFSLRGVAQNSSYNVSKHGLSGLTKSVAKEYAHLGITCNEICPSAVESAIMNGIAERKEMEGIIKAEEYLAAVRVSNPTGRMAYPEDIANIAYFLASDDAQFINGAAIVVDGGQIC